MLNNSKTEAKESNRPAPDFLFQALSLHTADGHEICDVRNMHDIFNDVFKIKNSFTCR